MKELTLWVIAPVHRPASPGIFSFPICPRIWRAHIHIQSVKCFCLQRSDENHKQSQTRFLVCYGLKQVNMFFDNQKFNLWKRQPSAVGESWDTAPSEFPPCFFFFRRGFASTWLLQDWPGKYQKQRLSELLYYPAGETWLKDEEFTKSRTRTIQPWLLKTF